MKLKFLVIAYFFSFFSLSTFAQKEMCINFIKDKSLEQIKELAKKEKKNIFVDCFATWCGPCKQLDKKTFTAKEVGEFFNAKFINVKYDIEKGFGKEFHDAYVKYIPGVPTMLVLDESGEVLHSITGFREPATLIKSVDEAMKGKTLPKLQAKYDSGDRSTAFMHDYTDALREAYQMKKLEAVVNDFTATLPVEAILEADIWPLASPYVKDPYSSVFQYLIKNLLRSEHKFPKDAPRMQRQLYSALRDATNELLDIDKEGKWKESTADSLVVIEGILKNYPLNNSAQLLARLELMKMMQVGKDVEILDFIDCMNRIELLRRESDYLRNVYSYLTDKLQDPQELQRALNDVILIQKRENNSRIPFNFYDTIAKLQYKLGNKIEGDKAQEEFKLLEASNREKLKFFMDIFTADTEQ